MSKICLITLYLFTLLQIQATANPFSCKIPETENTVSTSQEAKLTYKGYLVSDNRRYGIIQINRKGYEVSEGDIIQGFKILQISKLSLKYQYMETIYNSHL